MSLKDKLRSLIEATFTSKNAYIADQAMPSLDAISVSIGEAGSINNNYIAPDSGYLVFNGTADESGKNQQMWNAGNFNPKSSAPTATSFTNWMPVKKGDTITFYYDAGISEIAIRFYRTVGGGLKSFVYGGGLCLLSHLLKRFSSSVVAKQCRVTTALSNLLPSGRGAALLPRLMGISRFFLLGIRENSVLSKFNVLLREFITKSARTLVIKDTGRVLFRVKKATQLTTVFRSAQQLPKLKPTSQKPLDHLSVCAGGAL